uniref:Uncharacterized protein n=1 Tax=Oryza glumipatula TaxID=40148 RepID=A0A0E0ABC7_9ORYZ
MAAGVVWCGWPATGDALFRGTLPEIRRGPRGAARRSSRREERLPSEEGIVPEMQLSLKERYLMGEDMAAIVGIEPTNLF